MLKNTSQTADEVLAKNLRRRTWRKAVSLLGCIVVFCTTYALILPAITLEGSASCGLAPHQHTEDCYEPVLVCGQEETGTAIHAHTEDCIAREQRLICTDEDPAHQHTEACYETVEAYICGLAEGDTTGHVHTEECYERTLTCGLEEHTHTPACYLQPAAADSGLGEAQAQTVEPATPETAPAAGLDAEAIGGAVTRTFAGEDYTVTVRYGPEARLPEDVCLTVRELTGDEYDESCQKAAEALGVSELRFARFFDVGFEAGGEKLEPAAPVEVSITYAHIEIGEELVRGAVHFTQDGTEVLETELEQRDGTTTFAFTQGSFSVVGTAVGAAGEPAAQADQPVFDNTVSPASSVINVFDYWFPLSNATDYSTLGLRFPKSGDNGSDKDNHEAGINAGHTLKFRTSSGGTSGSCNPYHGQGVCQGIVAKTLTDGYPVLSGDPTIVNGSTESLDYLFDPDYQGASAAYRKVFKGVQGLLYEEDGYYTYDSVEHYAYLPEVDRASGATETGNKFILYDTWGVGSSSTGNDGEFFPFNDYPEQGNIAKRMSHYFGLTLTARFIQEYGGHTNASRTTPTRFTFSGDDDVWIFIDDVLVADLGGIHDKIGTVIDFSTGEVTVEKVFQGSTSTTIRDAFIAAGRYGTDADWNGNTFADNTTHTLKFFYMERGNNESNMSLRYNLNEIPATSIYKVNQYGDLVAGAVFSAYRVANPGSPDDWSYNDADPVFTGTTDAKGEIIFKAEDGSYYSLADMEKLFGDRFVLKETQVPPGYRKVSDEIYLRIYNGALVCENTYESGVWASPTVQVTAPNALTPVDPDRPSVMTYYNPLDGSKNGTLFAVVLKYIGETNEDGTVKDVNGNGDVTDELSKQGNWALIRGSSEQGYTISTVTGDQPADFVTEAIATAKTYGTENLFEENLSIHVMQANLRDLPGKVINYYHMLADSEKEKTQYTIGYYWTSAASLDGADSSNTLRINAEDVDNEFYRAFGANIEVPDLSNRLLVQKYDEKGNLVNGATFALFPANEDGTYRADDGTPVDLANVSYTTAVTPADGDTMGHTVITVTDNGETITSHEQRTTNSLVLKDTGGTCVFGIRNVNLTAGCYYLREVAAPDGYEVNPTEIMVRVTEDAIYANAGTADDGVRVGRGPGYIVRPLHKAASEGQVDETLTWIYQTLQVSDVSTRFADAIPGAASTSWGYAKNDQGETYASYLHYVGDRTQIQTTYVANYAVDEEGQRIPAEGYTRTHTQLIETETGWSYNQIYQDTAFGRSQLGLDSSVNYTDLSDQGDISNLFSRSVYVRVTDETKRTDLEISKTVPDMAEGTAEFTFTVTVAGAEGKSYPYTVYSLADTGRETPLASGTLAFPADGVAALTLANGRVAVITDLPVGAAFTVTETAKDHYTTTHRVNGGDEEEGLAAAGTLAYNGLDDRTTYVDFTNTPNAMDLTLNKRSDEDDAPLPGAQFVLFRTVDGEVQYYRADGSWAALAAGEQEAALAISTDSEGKITFLALPDGSYTLREIAAPEGYIPPDADITLTVNGGRLAASSLANHDDTSITVYNSKGHDLPHTGGAGTKLFTMGGLLLIFGAGLLLYHKNKRGKEDSASF